VSERLIPHSNVETVPLSSLYISLERGISDILERAVRRSWQEDHLSYSVCDLISGQAPLRFRSALGEDVQVEVEIFKNDGVVEERHGDIAVVLSIGRESTPDIFGLGFLEAKRRYTGTGRFDKFSAEQLEKIERNTPHALILLYDYENIAFNADLSREGDVLEAVNETRAAVVPLNLARALNTKSTRLYRHSAPLGHQLCYRYLHGLDLDLVGTPDEMLRFFPSADLFPEFVLRMQVSHGATTSPPKASLPSGFLPIDRSEDSSEAQAATGTAEEDEPPTATMWAGA
jgi:hypothetical protein